MIGALLMKFVGLIVIVLAVTLTAQNTPAYKDAKLPASVRAHDVVSRMTLEEKAAQLEDYAPAIPRLGIPDYQTWSEALHGVANSGYATVFPQAIGMAATWDPAIVQKMGEVISREARAKYDQAQRQGNHRIFYGLTFWSPNINIFRDPRWGRGQETYGEDPFLTGRMGVAFIRGVQGPDSEHPIAVATSKHFAVHSGPESTRHVANVDVSPRDLEETYLPAFRTTVTDGKVKSVMCAYNAINGMAACANTMLLKDHLRDAWGFKGFVVSDCGAIVNVTGGHHNAPDIMHASAISLAAGTDLSCSIWTPGFNTLATAVRQNLVSEALVTQAAERLFTARFELGMFDSPGKSVRDRIPASVVASAEHEQVSLKAAEESIVLLKNNGILPLRKAPQKIAVIGPTAELLTALEGNYNGQPQHPKYPLDGIKEQFKNSSIRFAQGATIADGASLPVPRTVFGEGLHTEYFATPDWTGVPVATGMDPDIQHDWRDSAPVPEVETHDYSVRWTGQLRVPAPGRYVFIVENGSPFPYSPKESYRFVLDGKILSEGELREGKNSGFAEGASPTAPPMMPNSKPVRIEVTMQDSQPHDFRLEYSHSGDRAGGGLALYWQAPAEAQVAEAVAAAKDSDLVLAFVGLSPQLEGEEMPVTIDGFNGGDRTRIELPTSQERMLQAVAATGKPIVLVSLSGSAVALTWGKEHADAVLQTWYPGGQGGVAIARTLAGLNNPAGRLPVTFYASTSDLPSFSDYSLKSRTYRYYSGKPLWGFGFGLSYSKFTYGPIKLSSSAINAGDAVVATITVTNHSNVAGDEVVEAYVKTPQPSGPIRSLAGFERVHLNAGEKREVSVELSPRSLSSVDEKGERSILEGSYHLTLGGAQPEETGSKSEIDFTVRGSKHLPR
jgi:beta-glucosidase